MNLVSKEYKRNFTRAVLQEVERINAKIDTGRMVSKKDKLWREYAITYLDNPTDLNMVLFTSGKETKMIRR